MKSLWRILVHAACLHLVLVASSAGCGSSADVEQPSQVIAGLGLHRAEPAIIPTAGQVPVTLLGQAFQRGARLQLDGVDVALNVRSSEHAEFVAPERYGHIGGVALTLTNPSGEHATVQGLLTYSATELDFVAPRVIDLSLQIADIITKDLDQDGYSDLIVSLFQREGSEWNKKGRIVVLWGISEEPYFTKPEILAESEDAPYLVDDNLHNEASPRLFLLQRSGVSIDTRTLQIVSYRKSDNSLQKIQSLEVGCLADRLLVNDLDSDDFADAIIECTDGIIIYWGGRTGFSAKRFAKIGLPGPFQTMSPIVSTNLDDDKWLDLVFGGYYPDKNESEVYVFRHISPRELKPIKAISMAGELTAVVPISEAVNNSISLAISSNFTRSDSTVMTKLSFLQWHPTISQFRESTPQEISGLGTLRLSADLSGDGKQDLVITDPGTGFLYRSPQGHYIESLRYMPNEVNKVLSDDFNHDGIMDVIVLPIDERRIFLLASETHLSPLPERLMAPEILLPSIEPERVALFDMNQDGRADVIVAGTNKMRQSIQVLGQSEYGEFMPKEVVGLDNKITRISSVLPGFSSSASYNGVIAVGYEINDTHWKGWVQELKPTKFGGLGGESSSIVTPIITGAYPRAVTIADVNNDGIMDLITANSGPFLWSVLMGKPSGGFFQQTTKCMTRVGYENPKRVLTGDFNEDGKLDLVILRNLGDTAIDILLGDGKGEFCPAESAIRAFWADDIVLVDANGDSHLDVLSVGSRGILGYYPGDGKGRFGASIVFDTRCASQVMTVGDLTGDHVADIVFDCMSADTGPRLDILRGDGHGGFGGRMSIPVEACLGGLIAPQVFIHDLDRDGRPELLFNQCGQSLTVFRNRSR